MTTHSNSTSRWRQPRRLFRAIALLATFLTTLPESVRASTWPVEVRELVREDQPVDYVEMPDWNQISLADFPGILSDGSIGSEYNSAAGYDLSRHWYAGDTPDQFLKLGDVADAFGAEQLAVGEIAALANLNLNQVSLSQFPLVGEQTLADLAEAVPGLGTLKIEDIAPIAALLSFQWQDYTLAQVFSYDSGLGELRLNQIDLASFAVSSLPGLEEAVLKDFEDWRSSLIKDVPGLGQVPLGMMPIPVVEDGVGIARIDAVWSTAESNRRRTLSGSYQEGFSVDCDRNCAHVELDDLENFGRQLREGFEGKQWISGKYQQVKGGTGCLAGLIGSQEPTGRHPFGSAFKMVVMETDEVSDRFDTALYFKAKAICGSSPYFIGPVPFLEFERDDWLFYGPPDLGVNFAGESGLDAIGTTGDELTVIPVEDEAVDLAQNEKSSPSSDVGVNSETQSEGELSLPEPQQINDLLAELNQSPSLNKGLEESTEIRDTAQLDPGWGAGNEDYLENQEAIIEGIRQTMPQPLSVALDIAPVAGDAKEVVEAITGRDAVVGEELANWQRALGAVPVFGGILQKSGSLVEKLVVRFPQAWTVIKNAGSYLDELLDWLSSKLPGWKHQHATTTSEGLLIEIPDEVAREWGEQVMRIKGDNLPAPRPGAPGSPEHKAARWREYQERTQGQGWNYERWSNVYEQNMKKARIANAKVDAYHAKIGWGQREVSIDVGTNVRILDIADKETLKGIEYKSGYRYADSETLEQVEKDKVLVAEGWDIEWVFEGTASKPLLEALEEAGIRYKFNNR